MQVRTVAAGGGACVQVDAAAVTHLCSLTSDMAGLSLLDPDEAAAPPAGGAECELLALPPGPVWPPVFPYQDPVPHPYSSPLPLHQQLAQGGGGGGSQHSEGDLELLRYRPFDPPAPPD